MIADEMQLIRENCEEQYQMLLLIVKCYKVITK